jgi:hypothetical protein
VAPVRQVEADLSFILTALRQRILSIHRVWPRRLVGQDLAAMTETLGVLEQSLLAELRNIGNVGKPGFLEDDAIAAVGDVESQLPPTKVKTKHKEEEPRGRR